ncbi:hypothetical protein GF325_04580 [Candidatus Bathyarchaeota archaeon]|nr:hypothetical protein [Candidatus Bathyarchaeota archaeon]
MKVSVRVSLMFVFLTALSTLGMVSGGIPGYPVFMLAGVVVVGISLISLARQKRLLG